MRVLIIVLLIQFMLADVTNTSIAESCEKTADLSKKEVFAVLGGMDIDEASHRAKCFLNCQMEANGLIKNGEFVPIIGFYALLPDIRQTDSEFEENFIKMKKCIRDVYPGPEPCEFAYRFSKCVIQVTNKPLVDVINVVP